MFRRTLLTLTAAAALMSGPVLAESHMAKKDIVETATEAGDFATLLAAAEAAGLVDTLKGDGPYTVFAPTDEAFAALPEGTVDSLLMPENKDQLTEILTYHVVPGKVMSTDLSDGMMAATVEGEDITVSLGDSVMVNEATVVMPDVEASNGVIHVIDGVLMPKS
ncbi:fasciclin domain-containing protein [Pseudooceanicola sp. C21-150M6]|uniref:fasciclin domain-containing protein n=1 Tax=Pseudooceanicola sp. C21-150M6 TaxID=3434355 RepID=UPI003D7F2F3D